MFFDEELMKEMENITMAFNCTSDAVNCTEEPYMPYSDRPETYILPFVFSIILIIGVTGNGILVLTILRHANMRNVPNTYVLSLALGDLLVNIFPNFFDEKLIEIII